jgi:hypothetical protein
LKDKLGREISKGDTLARVDYSCHRHITPIGELRLYKVVDVSAFALLISPLEGPKETKVIEVATSSVIVDYAGG